MIFEALSAAAAKTGLTKVLGFMFGRAKNHYDDNRAGEDALDGGDPIGDGSLESAIGRILEKFANRAELSGQASAWVQSIDFQAPFVEVFLAEISKNKERGKLARATLAASYAAYTGEDHRLAEGEISRAVSYVYSQLTTTDAARQKFNTVLQVRTAAWVHELLVPVASVFPSSEELEWLRSVASRLLDGARATWKMPAFVAPLVLEATQEAAEGQEPKGVTAQELASAVQAGENILLWGEGGIGKTVFLLELAGLVNAAGGQRTAIYMDAAVWARSGQSVFAFLAENAVSQVAGLTPDMLAKFADGGYITLMLNGWNEIPASRKVYCRQQLGQLTSTNASLKLVATSRTLQETPGVTEPRKVAVRGLTWRGQSEVIRAELVPEKSKALLEQLARDTNLRRSARSPLILRGLIAQSQATSALSNNVFDLLGAVVSTFESDEHRAEVLTESPILGFHPHYLEELSSQLTTLGATNMARNDAVAVVGQTAAKLAAEGLLGASLQPSEMLTVLASQHLLHDQDGLVRFAHQRFQEFFGAKLLLRLLELSEDSGGFLRSAVNNPAWAEALELTAFKLQGLGEAGATSRAKLVQLASSVDLAYACELAGICGFSETDDQAVHDQLVHDVGVLSRSPLTEVGDLAAICKVASRLPAFAQDIWALLDSDNWRNALPSRHNSGTWISVSQLGPDVAERLSTWSEAQLREFVHEVASSAENFDFVWTLALSGHSLETRGEAIQALLWNYPASSRALQAWLSAPPELQLDSGIINALEHLLDEGIAVEEIKAQLKAIASSVAEPKARALLATLFPQEDIAFAAEQALERLRTSDHRDRADRLLSRALELAPEQVRALATELVLAPGPTPRWTLSVVRDLGPREQEALFEQMWPRLLELENSHNWPETLGSMASREQTKRSVTKWLELKEACSAASKVEKPPQDLCREVGRLLGYAPGDDLVDVILELAPSANYRESARLTDLLLQSCKRDAEEPAGTQAWVMQVHQVQRLIEAFQNKVDESETLQDEVFVNLAGIASWVAPSEFGLLLIEALRRQLDAWEVYRARMEVFRRGGRRPPNPGLGGFVVNALARWGLGAIPRLLDLSEHPSASELVPEAVGRIASSPWHSRRDGFFSSIVSDSDEGRRRRLNGVAFKQPTEQEQSLTELAASALVELLSRKLEQELTARSSDDKWNPRTAAYSLGKLVRVVAQVPSPTVVGPVLRVLRAGLLNSYDFVPAIRSLLRQGWSFTDELVAKELDRLVEEAFKLPWLDDSARHSLNDLMQLALLVEPSSSLSNPLPFYLEKWGGFARVWSVIDSLAGLKSRSSWSLLLEVGKADNLSREERERLGSGLARALVPELFPEFLQLVSTGKFFSFCQQTWSLEKLAPEVAHVAKSVTNGITLLIDACLEAASPAADDLLRLTLAEADEQEESLIRCGLEALDAGRAESTDSPAARGLIGLFSVEVPYESSNVYEVYPKSCNTVRSELYQRAKESRASGPASRRLLASIECSRRERDRPLDEPRHPLLSDDQPWTDVLKA